MRTGLNYCSTDWAGPGAAVAQKRGLTARMLRSLIFPPRGQRILPTATGYVLILLTLGMGMGAYQASSNIMFIVVSTLMASLVVSGIFSSVNAHRVSWRLMTEPPFRAGERARMRIEVRNGKKHLPAQALIFQAEGGRERWRRSLALGRRLDPGGVARLVLDVKLTHRGPEKIRIASVWSGFPFGFLRKTMPGGESIELIAWPRRVQYRRYRSFGGEQQFSGQAMMKPGHGSEFINLRDYQHGDSHREVHWKASARLRTLVVQQFAAESQPGYTLHVRTSVCLWPDSTQFEQLCSFVSSLAEDLFAEGTLAGARIDDEPPIRIGRRAELEFFQDRLSLLGPLGEDRPLIPPLSGRGVITFEPNSTEGIDACIGSQRVAAA